MDKLTEKLNKLSLPATILIASIILGGFYYAVQVSKQASIEKQQQIEIQTKKEADSAVAIQKGYERISKELCVSEAETSAAELYKDYCTKANYCTYKEGTFLTAQYESSYNRCLQKRGLK